MGRELSLYGSWGENFISTLTPTQEDSLNRHSDRKDGREIHSQLAHLLRPSQVDVSDDQTQFKAHKIFLSACSPVFKKIIESNPSQHPLVYLRGIQSHEMESILQFMYLGEGKFYHERMREFIKVAQDLEVKEISDGVELPSEEAEETIEENIPEEETGEDLETETPIQAEKTTIQQRRPRTQILNDNKSTQCPECGAEFTTNSSMVRHYRSKHEGVKYPCNQCDYQATHKHHLLTHIQSVHEGIKYPCNQCCQQFTKQSNLQNHIQSVHEGIKYSCDQCDQQFTQKSHLQRHIRSVHEGVKYPCNQCDYQATQQSKLQAHISAKHSDTVLKCDYCDYQTKWRQHYNKHINAHLSVIEFE